MMRKSAQVHRFHDDVALYVGDGQTIYISPREARKFTRAINKVCKSCESESFGASTDNTFSIEFERHSMDR